MSQNSIRDTFFEECEDLLEALVEGLEQIDDGDHSDETVNAVFRAVHSMKGGAGAFGLEALVGFAHTFETVLDQIRSHILPVDDTVMRILHRSGDEIAKLVEAERDGHAVDPETNANIVSELDALLGDQGQAARDTEQDSEFVFEALVVDIPSVQNVFCITFRPQDALYMNGHEPAFLMASLNDLGVLTVVADVSDIPDLLDMEPHGAYMTWTATLKTDCRLEDIEQIFEFVEGLCDLVIEDITVGVPPLPLSPVDVTQAPVTSINVDLDEATGPPAPNDTQFVEPKPQTTNEISASRAESSGPKTTLRVELDRVDRLINTVGELIINQSMIAQRIDALDLQSSTEIDNDLEDFKRLAREIQDAVMSIRAQPVKPLFQRMSRIVREAADATQKSAELVFEGENTEVDKTLIERLADPLTHMIRNAVDHGLEMPNVREAAGKDKTGTIVLSATHQSGSVLIKVIDNGAGLNRPKIKEIATGKGLISPDAELSENEIDNLLFLPGFSTASEVSNLSGRGVGMDVVKNAITGLGGRVSIASVTGAGTTFTIVLPLTLAVMDGMVVSIAGETLVVPITSVIETIRPTNKDMHQIGPDETLLSIRGSFVPVVDVARSLGLRPSPPPDQAAVCLLVETYNGFSAFLVDAIHDQRQVVVKGLEGAYKDTPGISAATILGDGKIALILDPGSIADPKLTTQTDAPPPQETSYAQSA